MLKSPWVMRASRKILRFDFSQGFRSAGVRKLVVIELSQGEPEGDWEVILEIGEDRERHSTRVTGFLAASTRSHRAL